MPPELIADRPVPPKRSLPRRLLHRIVENHSVRQLSPAEVRLKVREKYDGPQGALLPAASLLSLHLPLGERLLKLRRFDLAGRRQILDVGSGAGQIAANLLKYADPQARITCLDLSHEMLRRARHRLKSNRPDYVCADITELPFAAGTFDCLTCGYVIEHLPDPRPALAEMARVMAAGASLMLLVTEHSLSGAFTSRLWCCRTFSRQELRAAVESVGLRWRKDLWFTRFHKLFGAGGICVEVVKD